MMVVSNVNFNVKLNALIVDLKYAMSVEYKVGNLINHHCDAVCGDGFIV